MNIEHYGSTIFAENARDALLQTADAVLDFGHEVKPRGLLTRELRHLTVIVQDPEDWSCAGMNANWSGRVTSAEALQLCGGFSDPTFAIANVPNLAKFVN